jgi:hypothetical protein
MIDYSAIRRALAVLPSDHDASGEHRPTVEDIFTPDRHASALDPNTPVVVGARGTGKSFWAGVLGQDDTRAATALAYPNLGLDRLIVRPGYSGLSDDNTVAPKTIEARVPRGSSIEIAFDFWQAVIMRSAISALHPAEDAPTIRECMERFSDPEDLAKAIRSLDRRFAESDRTLLVTFDALDTLSREWVRSGLLVDALFEVIWSLRARRNIKAKIFIRPEQFNDDSLSFVELPKLRSGQVELEWNQVDLYGLLYWRLSTASEPGAIANFRTIVEETGSAVPLDLVQRRRGWPLLSDRAAQKAVMDRLAGLYMGKTNKKGGTYDWPYKHLSDAGGRVTPRSFIKLFSEAAKIGPALSAQVISAEGIRHGVSEASKVRVDQLALEYKWIKRALAPLGGVVVPCEPQTIFDRWSETNTIDLILEAADDEQQGFLPPFPPSAKGDRLEMLAQALQRIGVISYRDDGRIDIPDLFRIAALMLKKGGIPPRQRR